MRKVFISLTVMLSFCFINFTHAESLDFKPGDQASYRLYQKIESVTELFGEVTQANSDVIIELDVNILSSNPRTLSFPFDVEVVLRGISMHEVLKDDEGTTTTIYDSHSMMGGNPTLAAYFLQLIDYPLYFRVNGDFQVNESSGYLYRLYEKNKNSDEINELFGATTWTYELFLSQLFQLSGKNLVVNKSYPITCYQLLNWEDDKYELNAEENVMESCSYIVKSIDDRNIKASVQGSATITDPDLHLNGQVYIDGDVVWNTSNPLIQKRKWRAEIEEVINTYMQLRNKLFIQQRWESTQ